jgi:antitoxin CptB
MSAGAHQADEARRRRLRWRARRGLLENDLVMARFFDRFESGLGDDDVAGLDRLLDLPDGELLELILGRRELEGAAATPQAQRVLAMLRSV